MGDLNNDELTDEGKEISPGIILHKEFSKEIPVKNAKGLYIWKIEVKTMSVIEFELDLTGSQNLELQGQKNKFTSKVDINPFEKKEIGKIILYDDWKLKSKFKIVMKVPDKAIQKKFVEKDELKIAAGASECQRLLKDTPLEMLKVEDIEKVLAKKNISKFVDPEFPPNDDSFFCYRYGNVPRDNFEYLVHWRRPEDFVLFSNDEEEAHNEAKEIKVIEGNDPEPNDVFVSTFPDTFLASALSGIAEKFNLVQRLFGSLQTSKYGVYQVNLFVLGQLQTLVIDDMFPCIPMNNPFVLHSPSNELWVLLIEKAMAKVFEGYWNLMNITIPDCLLMLTGCPTFYFVINEVLNDENLSGLISKLSDYVIKSKYLAIAFSCREDQGEEEEENNEFMTMNNYGYTIIDIKERNGSSLIYLRKVWHDSDKEKKLQDYKAGLVAKFPSVESEMTGGTMILTAEDFIKEFSNLAVCYTKTWEEIRVRGKFIRARENKTANYEQFMSQWYYCFTLDQPTTLVVSLFQDQDNFKQEEAKKQIIDLSLTVLTQDKTTNEISHLQTIDFANSPSIQQELILPKGDYIILPRTTGSLIYKQNESNDTTNIIYDKKNKRFNRMFISTISDIFKQFDLSLSNKLGYFQFKELYEEMTGTSLDQRQFIEQILPLYANYENSLTEKGLIQFFEKSYEAFGEKEIKKWLNKLGYDDDLFCDSKRCFVLTIHSEFKINIEVMEAIDTEINSKVNRILLKNFKETKKSNENDIKIVYFQSKNKYNTFVTVGVENVSSKDLRVNLKIKDSNNGIVMGCPNEMERIVKGRDIEYFCHFYYLFPTTVKNVDYHVEIKPI